MWKSQHWTQTLEHEGEPVLSLSQALPLPVEERRPDRRMERYYRHLGELWKNRWAAVLYPRACAALQEARAGSRPFLPWEAELVMQIVTEEMARAMELAVPLKAEAKMGATWYEAK